MANCSEEESLNRQSNLLLGVHRTKGRNAWLTLDFDSDLTPQKDLRQMIRIDTNVLVDDTTRSGKEYRAGIQTRGSSEILNAWRDRVTT